MKKLKILYLKFLSVIFNLWDFDSFFSSMIFLFLFMLMDGIFSIPLTFSIVMYAGHFLYFLIMLPGFYRKEFVKKKRGYYKKYGIVELNIDSYHDIIKLLHDNNLSEKEKNKIEFINSNYSEMKDFNLDELDAIKKVVRILENRYK